MKIKTIWTEIRRDFDHKVNDYLAAGWTLVRREVLLHPRDLNDSVFYAELVWPDQLPEVAPDPIEALQALRDFCDARECTEDCRLYAFCNKHLPACEGPADWTIPGEEAVE